MQESLTLERHTLVANINQLLAAGRVGPAKPLVAALRRTSPGHACVSELAARLAIMQGDTRTAQTELDHGLSLNPLEPALLRSRADLRRRLGDVVGAAQDAAEAVIADPRNATGKAILGILMVELGRPKDGVACLEEAVASEPGLPDFREALAQAQAAGDNEDAAAATLNDAINSAPAHIGVRNAAVLLALRRGRFADAVALAEDARQYGHADARLFGLKAHALSRLGRSEEAAETYAEALRLGPADAYVRHLVSTTGARPGDDRAPPEYLRALFDNYAERFKSSLIGLGYRIPGVIRHAIETHVNLPAGGLHGPALDLGCGTGLVAVALHDLPIGPIYGVDISRRMLELADQKKLYASLREADLLDVLNEPEPSYQLIFAADVLCYFGDLGRVLRASFSRLCPGGLLLASVEEAAPDLTAGRGWRLGPHGRYAHAARYLEDISRAAGFDVTASTQEVVRLEAGAPVHGRFAVLRRPAQ